ncbi:MAG TPA: KTSC domain-containing protein [Longimicrobiaceae bacterium]|nr:KTSC domain-containing protein [Longimicrobiaceae bacterium]
MQREHVDSSSIGSVGYDQGTHTLEVEFLNGGVYQYLGVPEGEYASLLRAQSAGRYLNYRIKPRYRYRRVRAPK